jgi:Secretion system C-terminal sorting domain
VILPKLTGNARYVDENKVKIPCFTDRKVIGEKLTGMLPSLVGIKRPDSTGTIQALTQRVDSAKMLQHGLVKTAGNEGQSTVSDVNNAVSNNGTAFRYTFGWDIAPNPVSNEVTLSYNFKEPNPPEEKSGQAISIEVFNDIGQLVTNYQLPETQMGKLDINVTAWQNGTYTISLTSGKVKQVKRMVVLH